MIDDLRASVNDAVAKGNWTTAVHIMQQLLRSAPNAAAAQFIINYFRNNQSRSELLNYRVAFLRSFTLEPVIPLLRAMAALHGVWLSFYFSDFNAYTQEIVEGSSGLYKFDPQAVVLALQLQDIAPELWARYSELSADRIQSIVDTTQARMENLINSFRARHQAHLIVHNFESPSWPALGLLDTYSAQGQLETVHLLNRKTLQIAAHTPGAFVLDYDALIARHGRLRWRDERKWLSVRMPISADCLTHLAAEYLRFLLPLAGRTCKALVIDLDNTIWGGVIGEDGLNGIHIGPEYPGAAFLAVQRAILDLYNRGIILAICSKNNPADALEALAKHPSMLLRPDHFSASRINWNNKAQNIREIAQELNIGLDSIAFLDDSPQERELIRKETPEVVVIDLPEDSVDYSLTLRQCPSFERLQLSAEDQARARYYVQEQQRKELRQDVSTLEEFYRSLEMVVEVAQVDASTMARVVQLTQKTNQFNLTGQRYTEQEIKDLLNDADWRVYCLRAPDRFGDSGIVGVAVTHKQGNSISIENLLMSCRVIGRTLETAFLACLAQEAIQQEVRWLKGEFIHSKKNAPAKDFYSSHGFHLDGPQDNSYNKWIFDLQGNVISIPEWIDCRLSPSCLLNR